MFTSGKVEHPEATERCEAASSSSPAVGANGVVVHWGPQASHRNSSTRTPRSWLTP